MSKSERALRNKVEELEEEKIPEGREVKITINKTFVDEDLNVTGGEVHRTVFDENMNGETERYELGKEEAELIRGE